MSHTIVMIGWDEIEGKTNTTYPPSVDVNYDANDDEIVALARKLNGDDGDDEPNWRMASIARGERSVTIEWRSARNHLATTQLIWW